MDLAVFGDDGVSGGSGAHGADSPNINTPAQSGTAGGNGTAGEAVSESPSALAFDPDEAATIHLVGGDGGYGGQGGNGGNGTSQWVVTASFVHEGNTYIAGYTNYTSDNGQGAAGGHGAVGGDSELFIANAAMTVLTATVVGGVGGIGGRGGGGGVGYQSGGYLYSDVRTYPGGNYAYYEQASGSAAGHGGNGGDGGDGGLVTISVGSTTLTGATLTAIAASYADGTIGGGRGGNGGGDGQINFHAANTGGDGGNGGDGGYGGTAEIAFANNILTFNSVYNFVASGGNATHGADGGTAGRGHVTSDTGTTDPVTTYYDGHAGGGGDGGNGGNATITFSGNQIAGSGSLHLSFSLTGGSRGIGGQGGANPDGTFANDGQNGIYGQTSLVFSGNIIDGNGGTLSLTLRNKVHMDTWSDASTSIPDFEALGAVYINLTTGVFKIGTQANTITNVSSVDLDIQDGYTDYYGTYHNHARTATVIGSALNNVMTGGAGNDSLNGADGNDVLDGGTGADTLTGGLGDDTFIVDNIGDVVNDGSGQGTDLILADVDYTLVGRTVETLTLTNGYNINATGNSLANTLNGNIGNNVLDGGAGNDTLVGSFGDDTYYVNSTNDNVVEANGQGTDTIYASATYSLSGRYAEFLTLTGTGSISATGNSLANTLTGNGSANTLTGLGGNDRLDGGAGNDSLIGGAGDDTFVVNAAGDVVTELAGEGTDLVESSVAYTLASDVENLTLTGAGNINGTGNAGNNVLTGNSGTNTLAGGLGNDTYYVQNTVDHVSEASGAGTDSVFSSVTYSLAGKQAENLTLTGSDNLNATGNGLVNILTGNSGANALDGGAGHDMLDGGVGADSLVGGSGNDTFVVDSGTDVVTELAGEGTDLVNASVSYALAANVENLTLTGSAAINATGNDAGNVLTGNSGINVLTGGLGNDTYYVQNATDNVVEANGQGTDVIYSTVSYSLTGRYAESIILTGTTNINATGNSFASTLVGNSGKNTLNGKAGADILTGGLGQDIFLFEAGSGLDTITDFSAAQNDTINVNGHTGGVANTSLVTQSGGDVLISLSSGNVITVSGALVADVLAHMVW